MDENLNIQKEQTTSDANMTNSYLNLKYDEGLLIIEKRNNNFGPGSARSKKKWTVIEDNLLLEFVSRKSGKKRWKEIASFFNNKSAIQCRSRWERIKPGIKTGRWTKEEDEKMKELYNKYGDRWSFIAKRLNYRTGKQVRERCNIILYRKDRRGKLKKEDKLKLINLYNELGPNWISIKKLFNDNYNAETLKNAFYAFYRRKEKKGQVLFKYSNQQESKESSSEDKPKLRENTCKNMCSKSPDSIFSNVSYEKKETVHSSENESLSVSNSRRKEKLESTVVNNNNYPQQVDGNISYDPRTYEQLCFLQSYYGLEMQTINMLNTYIYYLQSASILNNLNVVMHNYAAIMRNNYRSFCKN
jgi:hypothetical protein